MKQRHFPFFPEHWKGEVALRMCSAAARGLWIDLLCEMHSAQPYGHLATSTGVPISTPEHIAKITGEQPSDVKRWIGELERAQVFSRTESGTIFSRRMVRDAEGREAWRDRQTRSRRTRDDNRDDNRDDGVTKGGLSRESHAAKGKDKGKKDTDVSSPDGKDTVSPRGRKTPVVEPGPAFGDLEADVRAFIATVAAENRSGTITAAREASLRRELVESLEAIGDRGAFAHGIREAVKHGAGNVRYAAKASKSYSPLMADSRRADDGEPESELEALDDYAEELEAERLRRESETPQ